MNLDNARSCVYTPSGEPLLRGQSGDSRVFYVSLPLKNGKLAGSRRERMQSRTPERYASMYLDMRYATDLASWYELPEPGAYRVTALMMPPEQVFSDAGIEAIIGCISPDEKAQLLALPIGTARSIVEAQRKITAIAERRGIDIFAGVKLNRGDKKHVMIYADASGKIVSYPADYHKEKLQIADTRHARVLIAEDDELMHPETALILICCCVRNNDVIEM